MMAIKVLGSRLGMQSVLVGIFTDSDTTIGYASAFWTTGLHRVLLVHRSRCSNLNSTVVKSLNLVLQHTRGWWKCL